jgi:hypothetical protein
MKNKLFVSVILTGLLLGQLPNCLQAQEAYAYYLDEGDVETVSPDLTYSADYCSWGYASAETSDYALQLDSFLAAYEDSFGTDTVVVAVLDSGIRATHDAFRDASGKSRVLYEGADFTDGAGGYSYLSDTLGHGTHVAGIIAEGTPDNVQLMSIKIVDDSNRGTLSGLIRGMEYAIDHGVDVINLSISGYSSSGSVPIIDQEIDKAIAAGIVVVTSAGNRSSNADNYFPGNSANAINVSAIDSNGQLASFSNYGSCVDLLAPGTDIVSAWSGATGSSVTCTAGNTPDNYYASVSGTSQAAAHVSAAAALLKLYDPSYDSADILDILQSSAANNAVSPGNYAAKALILGAATLPGHYYYNGRDYGAVFNPVYYLTRYEDLMAESLKNDENFAFWHFITYGMKEGRQACATFDVTSYKNANVDLREAFGNDLPSYYEHYLQYGINENRTATGCADHVENARTVYLGVDYSSVYDFNYYIAHHPDVFRAFGYDDEAVLQHFVTCGMKEGRQACAAFNVWFYKDAYMDLQNAFGEDLPFYYLHYMQYGADEKRAAA